MSVGSNAFAMQEEASRIDYLGVCISGGIISGYYGKSAYKNLKMAQYWAQEVECHRHGRWGHRQQLQEHAEYFFKRSGKNGLKSSLGAGVAICAWYQYKNFSNEKA